MPIGTIIMFGGNSTPSNFLPCDGTFYSNSSYPSLQAVIGYTYGGSSESGTFAVPDMRSRSPIGVGTGSDLSTYVLGQNTGSETVTLSTSQLPAHSHGFSHGGIIMFTSDGTGSFNPSYTSGTQWIGEYTTDSTGSGSPTPIIHPIFGIGFFIQYQ